MRPKFSNFYVRSGLFGVMSLVAAALNYALYPVLTRILSTTDFGDFAAVVAISNQVLSLLLAFNIISIYLVKTLPEESARRHAQTVQKMLIWLFLGLTVLVFAISPFLHNLLKIQNPASFIVLAILLFTAVPAVIWTGYLQGNKEMIRIGAYNLGAALTKLILGAALAASFGTVGGIWGLLGGGIVGLFVLWVYPGVRLPQLGSIFKKSLAKEKRFVYSLKGYIIGCLLLVGGLGFLQNYDITLAKTLFSADSAGLYSGISILSNALYYLSFLLVWIILPEIKLDDHKNNRRILGTAYKILCGLSLATLVFELLLKNHLAGILLGSSFAGQGNLLIFASLYQITLVAVTLYVFYLLVTRQKKSALLGGLVFAGTTLVPAIFSTQPINMIYLMWFGMMCGVGLFYGLLQLQFVARFFAKEKVKS
jgi:O-antigen/teichoic acid export membrane protein